MEVVGNRAWKDLKGSHGWKKDAREKGCIWMAREVTKEEANRKTRERALSQNIKNERRLN